MDTDAIGSAAAVEALKMSAAQNQSHLASSKPAASPSPSGNPPHKTKLTSKPPPKQEEEEEEGGSSAQDKIMAMAMGKLSGLGGSIGGSSHASENHQDKIIALAMSQAGKLFDKKHGGAGGGNPAAKVDGSCII